MPFGVTKNNLAPGTGKNNLALDTISRACSIIYMGMDLTRIHEQLGHPGVMRLLHFVKTKNFPFSVHDVKSVCSECKTCAELKSRFFRKTPETLIKALHPWERISIDFKGPVEGKNKYLLFVVDEFSRFPFVFACRDVSTPTVIQCLSQLFCLFGLPLYVHSDQGTSFLSKELKQYLSDRGVATSRSTLYDPTGNAQ